MEGIPHAAIHVYGDHCDLASSAISAQVCDLICENLNF